ncbi:MAG: carboxymuconolactone decarboxylase family protein [Pseudomonadota bacterium]
MPYIKTVSEEEASGIVADSYRSSRAAVGGIYETSRIISTWPELLKVEEQRYFTIMLAERNLTRMEKEAIAIAVSKRNDCHYCLEHHKAMFVSAGGDIDTATRIEDEPQSPELPDRLRDMISFALSQDQSSAPVDKMRNNEFSDDELLEIIIVAGFFHDYNLRVSRFGLELEDWFSEEHAQ